MKAKRSTAPNRQILEEAAEFFVEIGSGDDDPALRRRFDAWLQTSPEHVRTYLELMPIWEEGAFKDESWGDTPEALIARARAEANVVGLPSGTAAGSVRQIGRGRHKKILQIGALAASLVVAVLGAFVLWKSGGHDRYSTATGEQRSIALDDGSTVQLNARSRIAVRYTEATREIELLEGQALFQAAREPVRPFIVTVGSAQVRAVGTRFDVYKKRSGTWVTVVEGRVAVSASSRGASSPEVLLDRGQRLALSAKNPVQAELADTAAATAWTQRQLVFDLTPLAEVADEFNRYNRRQLVIDDARLADFHVTGVFSSTNPASLVRFLRDQPGITVQDAGGDIHILTR